MAMDTVLLIAATYDRLEDAELDYDAVRTAWAESTVGDTYDAAVVARDADGKVRVVHRHEEPVLRGSVIGGGVGIALGALAAIFPAIGLGAGVLLGAAAGAGLGAAAGHVVGGMSRDDLKELGELLDDGSAALVAIVAQDTEARVEAVMARGRKQLKTRIRADEKALERALDEALRTGDG
ncbi:DUF1269 domain-containing protein [Agromyces arachidis]|uniref:DUF1269 domain-containing protein n=1 Tax=Agromyces arachidis TaxID=766966 RepID=UPI0040578A70